MKQQLYQIKIQMQKNYRPHSAKYRRTLKQYQQNTINQSRECALIDLNEQNHESVQILRYARSKTPVVGQRFSINSTQIHKQPRQNSSGSRFLHKFDQIKIYRETGSLAQNQLLPTLSIEIPQKNQNVFREFKIQTKSTKNRPKTPIHSWDIKDSEELLTLNRRTRGLIPNNNRPLSGKKYAELPKLSNGDFIFKIQKEKQKQNQEYNVKVRGQVKMMKAQMNGANSHNKSKDSLKDNQSKSKKNSNDEKRLAKTAYLKSQNKFVTLFPMDKGQTINIQHENLLPIYAQVTLDGRRFVVSEQYQNYSLTNMFEEFKVLGETLAKRYLRQIALGLHHLHFQNKSHNCITPDTILYNKSGSLFINMLQALAIPQKDQLIKHKGLYYFSPDFLLQRRRNEPKNDVWGLGCLAIQMITGKSPVDSSLHPYNHSHYSPNQQTMIDNVKERYKDLFKTNEKDKKEHKQVKISQSARSFISECLKILKDQRPKILTLLQHQFLE